MKRGRTASLVVAALVLGLVVGGVMTGGAAPASDATASAPAAGMGLRLGAAMREAGGRLADVVAKLTGQDVDVVVEQRKAGTSYADIAEAYGVEADAVVAEALRLRTGVLEAKVADGSITQEQADAAIARMQGRLTERVASTGSGCGGGGMGRGGGKGRSGGMSGCGGACAQAAPVTP